MRQLTYGRNEHCLWLQGEKLLNCSTKVLGSVVEPEEATVAVLWCGGL